MSGKKDGFIPKKKSDAIKKNIDDPKWSSNGNKRISYVKPGATISVKKMGRTKR